MSGETLPAWFWGIYYLFLIGTVALSVITIFRGRLVVLSAFNIVLIVLAQLLSINMIARVEGTEWDFLLLSLKDGDLWAYSLLAIYGYVVYWWIKVVGGRTS